MLKVKDIDVYYGRVKALRRVSLEVNDGELITLLGANGAGKTTLLMAVSGITKPTSGTVEFQGLRIDRLPAHRIVSLGVAHVPQGRQLFADMTVLENLELGAYCQGDNQSKREQMAAIYEHFKILADRKHQKASTLSGGMQQMLAIARGLMLKPRLLLLDEPFLGLAPVIVEELAQLLTNLHKEGMAMLLVEQNATLALEIADKAYVMENGRVITSGRAHDFLESEFIKKVYLGLESS